MPLSVSWPQSSRRCNAERNLAVTRYCGLPGRVAQRESARFTRGRSLVRSQSRPSRSRLVAPTSAWLSGTGVPAMPGMWCGAIGAYLGSRQVRQRCRSSSVSSSSRRFETQRFVVPSWRATSASSTRRRSGLRSVSGSLVRVPTSSFQLIVFGIVETDEPGLWPFVDAVFEDPAGAAVPFPLPVDDAAPECCAGEGGERDPAWLEAEAELPALGDEVCDEVFSVMRRLEPGCVERSRRQTIRRR